MKENYDPEEVKSFIRELFEQMLELTDIEPDVKPESDLTQKDIEQLKMFLDPDWNWSGHR